MKKKIINKITAVILAIISAFSILPIMGITASAATLPAQVKGKTVSQVLGMDTTIYMNWLESHENDSYYIGTPYKPYDRRNPNGDCKGAYGSSDIKGTAAMNCTGFVWHVLYKATSASGKDTSKIPALQGWYTFYKNNNISRRYFSSKTEMLNSGYLEKGDIIWMFDGSETALSDKHHVGIYWGDGSSDVFWHSIDNDGNGRSGNIRSKVVPKSSKPFYVVLKVGVPSIKLQLYKSSSNTSAKYTSIAGAEYYIYTDSKCTHHLKTSSGANAYMKTDADGYARYGTGTNSINNASGDAAYPVFYNKNSGQDVPYGTYYAQEYKAAPGFAVNKTIYKFVNTGKKSSDGRYIYRARTLDGNSTTPKDNPYIRLQLMKSSSNTDITDDNSCYSLAGARYYIYTDKACTKHYQYNGNDAYITTDADGYGKLGAAISATNTDSKDKTTAAYKKNSGASIELTSGLTLYAKEDKNHTPPGYGYDDTVYTFKDSGSLASDGRRIFRAYSDSNKQPSDEPINDPAGILIKKYNAITGESVARTDLGGAIFEIQYYAQEIDKDYTTPGETAPTLDPANLKRTWYLQTDDDGYCDIRLPDSYLVDNSTYNSDELYHDSAGEVTLPAGTIVVREIVAPEGYTVSSKVFYRQITDNSNLVNDTQTPIEIPVDEQPANGYIGLRKMNTSFQLVAGATYGLFETNTCNSTGMINVSPVATVVTTNGNSGGYVNADGSFYQVFKDSSGNEFAAQIGKTYYIQEIKNPAGYTLDKKIYDITPSLDNLTPGAAIVQEVFEDTKVGDILIHKDSNDGVVANMWFSVQDSNGKQYKAVATDEDGNAKVTGLPLYDSNNRKLTYTVKELGFKVTNTTFSYGGYTWTIDTTKCINYLGSLYEGVANSIYVCSDPSVPTYSRYYYGDPTTAKNNQNIGITQTLKENGTVTYNFVNTAKKVDAEVYKSTFNGAENSYSIDFEVFDQFNNSYGIIRTRNGYGKTTNGVPEYGKNGNTNVQGFGKTMFASVIVPNTSVYIPLNYKVKELGFVTPGGITTTYFFPDSYIGLAESELKKSNAKNGVFTLTYKLDNEADVGNINISKSSEDGEVANLCFEISAWSDTECTDEDYLGFDSNGYLLHSVILKTDENGNASTKNADVYDSNGNLLSGISVYTLKYSGADEEGTTYKVKELGFDNGDGTYTLPKRYKPMEDKTFTLGENREVTYECVNEVKTSSLQVQKISEDNIVSDMWFRITSDYSINPIDIIVVTGEDGLSEVLSDLPIYQGNVGTENIFVKYTVEELGIKVCDNDGNWTGEYKIPNRYDKSRIKPSTVTLKDNDTATVTVVKKQNYLVTGTVTLYKQDENGRGCSGSEWALFKADGTAILATQTGIGQYFTSSTGKVKNLDTDANGRLIVSKLELGDYYFVETKPLKEHMPYGQKLEFTISADSEVTLYPVPTAKNDRIILYETGDIGANAIYFTGFTMLAISLAVAAVYILKIKKQHKRK